MAKQREEAGTLMAETIRLLDNLPEGKSLPDFASDMGISYYWLRKFKSGEIPNPSVNKVQKLYEHLTGKPLLIAKKAELTAIAS